MYIREIKIGDKIFQFKEEFTKNPDVWFKLATKQKED